MSPVVQPTSWFTNSTAYLLGRTHATSGRIVVADLDDVMIGETLADPDDPRPLPIIRVAAVRNFVPQMTPMSGKIGGRSGGFVAGPSRTRTREQKPLYYSTDLPG